jgi:hypothetical protein
MQAQFADKGVAVATRARGLARPIVLSRLPYPVSA